MAVERLEIGAVVHVERVDVGVITQERLEVSAARHIERGQFCAGVAVGRGTVQIGQ